MRAAAAQLDLLQKAVAALVMLELVLVKPLAVTHRWAAGQAEITAAAPAQFQAAAAVQRHQLEQTQQARLVASV
jgi:hypothetical protein